MRRVVLFLNPGPETRFWTLGLSVFFCLLSFEYQAKALWRQAGQHGLARLSELTSHYISGQKIALRVRPRGRGALVPVAMMILPPLLRCC